VKEVFIQLQRSLCFEKHTAWLCLP
jgi:hypothetical protein